MSEAAALGRRLVACLSPHPPLLIPEVGRSELSKVAKTVAGLQELAREVNRLGPDTVFVISPHAPCFYEGLALWAVPELAGDFAQFGAPGVKLSYQVDLQLVQALADDLTEVGAKALLLSRKQARRVGIPVGLDYATMVPLFYLLGERQVQLVSAGVPLERPEALVAIGRTMRRTIDAYEQDTGRKVLFIASGDLSHRLKPGAPAGYDPKGEEFDHALVELLEKMDVEGILHLDPELVERAGECGLRPLLVLLGSIAHWQVVSRVYSYEGPFGVGYAVAGFFATGETTAA